LRFLYGKERAICVQFANGSQINRDFFGILRLEWTIVASKSSNLAVTKNGVEPGDLADCQIDSPYIRNSRLIPTMPDSTPSAETLESIDRIDRQVLQLVDQRNQLVHRLCEADRSRLVGLVADAAARIQSIVQQHGDGQIESDSLAQILRHISSVCLQSVHQMRTAYLGPMHSYSHLAAIKYFGDAATLTPVASIPAVFDAVENGDALTGIVPIENSTDGRVVDTLGMFVRRDMNVCGEVLLPIHHNLLSKTPREQIREVHSKPQALSQCRGWLAKNLPLAQIIENTSTAAAAKLAAEKPGVAAVASAEAGRQYDLDVIDANIEDNPNNVTRFAVLGKERPARTGDDKTSILFQVSHQPGALADAMTIFKECELNLTWIESFPSPEAANEYLFFVELSGHRDDKPVAEAVRKLTKESQRLTILGSYPKAI
jgi:chorismate mutase/prephenate dehydratase